MDKYGYIILSTVVGWFCFLVLLRDETVGGASSQASHNTIIPTVEIVKLVCFVSLAGCESYPAIWKDIIAGGALEQHDYVSPLATLYLEPDTISTMPSIFDVSDLYQTENVP